MQQITAGILVYYLHLPHKLRAQCNQEAKASQEKEKKISCVLQSLASLSFLG